MGLESSSNPHYNKKHNDITVAEKAINKILAGLEEEGCSVLVISKNSRIEIGLAIDVDLFKQNTATIKEDSSNHKESV